MEVSREEEQGGGACQSDVGSLYSFRQLVECHEDTETKLCGKGGVWWECGVVREGCGEQ